MVLIPVVFLALFAQNPWPENTFTEDYPSLVSQLIYNPTSIVIYGGKEFMIAKDILLNGTQHSLRKDDGTPLWQSPFETNLIQR